MSNILYVATRKGLFVFRKLGNSPGWQMDAPHFAGEPVSMVLPDARDGSIHAALNLGHFGTKMRRSRDAGASWQETAVPAYPAQPADAGDEKPWTLQQVWSLECGGADQPGVLWAGTIPGGLFVSRDAGDSWQLVRSLWDRPERKQWLGGGYDSPGIHSICVDPCNSNHITLAVSCGGVWQSRDGGNNWALRAAGMRADFMPEERRFDQNIQDVHRMTQCVSAPEIFWVQHHGGIWRTQDNTASWHEIVAKPSSFGFAVAVHPQNPDIAWFVPAAADSCRFPVEGEFVVTRTRDGGKSFDVLRNGLPQQPAYDLVYRHGLDIDDIGNCLAMGSTTGGLWISENGGEQWHCINAHLPPIYAVRFGD